MVVVPCASIVFHALPLVSKATPSNFVSPPATVIDIETSGLPSAIGSE